jgi:hypothetical protein
VGLGLADAVGGGQAFVVVAVGARAGLEVEALAVRGDLLDLFVAEDRAEVSRVARSAIPEPNRRAVWLAIRV